MHAENHSMSIKYLYHVELCCVYVCHMLMFDIVIVRNSNCACT